MFYEKMAFFGTQLRDIFPKLCIYHFCGAGAEDLKLNFLSEPKLLEEILVAQCTGTGGAVTGTGGAVCKGATPSVEQPGGRGFKPRLRSLLD